MKRLLLFLFLCTSINLPKVHAQQIYPHKSGSQYGFYNSNNSLIISYQYDDALGFNENLAAVKKNGKWGYINASNTTVIPFNYDNAWYFTQGLAAVKKNGKWGYIDASNNTIIPFSYSDAADFSDGLAWVEKNAMIGFISKTGDEVIPFSYNAATAFESGIAGVQKNGKWGFINKTNTIIIPLQYDDATYVSDGFAPVKFGSYWGYFDTYGNQVTDFSFSSHNEETFINSTFASNYAAYSAKQLSDSKKGTSAYGIYKDHLRKAVQYMRSKQSYFSYSEWKKLADYYKLLDDDENYKIAKKNSKSSGGSYSMKRPRLYLGSAPVKLALYNRYHHLPLYAELSFRNVGLAARYNIITDYPDKWRFRGWFDSNDEDYKYNGNEYSGIIYFKKKASDFVPGVEVRYGTYTFNPFAVTLTDRNNGQTQIKNISPQIYTYDVSFVANYRKSWKIFYYDMGFTMGLGYKKWDFGYDQDQYQNSIKRFDEKWIPLQMPYRVYLRAGLRL